MLNPTVVAVTWHWLWLYQSYCQSLWLWEQPHSLDAAFKKKKILTINNQLQIKLLYNLLPWILAFIWTPNDKKTSSKKNIAVQTIAAPCHWHTLESKWHGDINGDISRPSKHWRLTQPEEQIVLTCPQNALQPNLTENNETCLKITVPEMLLAWRRILCVLQYFSVPYGSKNIHMNTMAQGFQKNTFNCSHY